MVPVAHAAPVRKARMQRAEDERRARMTSGSRETSKCARDRRQVRALRGHWARGVRSLVRTPQRWAPVPYRPNGCRYIPDAGG
jgi:hypothetical protein